MATVQVILKEKIANLGAEADVVPVRRGFARNFLIPQGKAFEATKGNLRQVAHLKKARAERESREMEEAEKVATKLRRLKLKLELATGQGGKAFGAITQKDIQAAILEGAGIEIDRHAIQLEKPIKSTGKFDVSVKVHADVIAKLKITVNASGAPEADAGDE